MGCKSSTDKKGEADYEDFANQAKEGGEVAEEIVHEIKGENKALSADTEDQLFEIYGVGVTVLAQTLIHIMRGESEAAKTLMSHAGAREVSPGHVTRKRDVHPDMLSGVIELLSLEGMVADLRAKDTPLLEIETAVRTATASWLLAHDHDGKPVACPKTPQQLFERYVIETYFDDPEGLTAMHVLEQVGLKGHNRHLTACPTGVYHKLHQCLATRTKDSLLEMRDNGTVISEGDAVSMQVLEFMLDRDIQYHGNYHKITYAIDHVNGCHTGLIRLLAEHSPVEDVEDLANYMLRVNGIAKKFKLVIAALKDQAASGFVPVFAFEKVAKSCQDIHRQLNDEPEKSSLYLAAFAKLEAAGYTFESVDDENMSRSYLMSAIRNAAAGYAALNETVTNLMSEHTATAKIGCNAKDYEWFLQQYTSNDASTIHHRGLEQVTMVEANINSCLDRLRSNGRLPAAAHVENVPIAEYIRILAAENRFEFNTSAEVGDSYRVALMEATERTKDMFRQVPGAEITVQDTDPSFHAGDKDGYYIPAALDGAYSAALQVGTPSQPSFGVRSVVARQAVPGLHYQASYVNLPFFRRVGNFFGSFSDGWALYAARLAQEGAFFATEPGLEEGFDLIGMLGDELLRAVRMVVDTGLHHFEWTRDQAVNFMAQHSALTPEQVAADVERCAVDPGAAVADMVGQLQLLDLRTQATQVLGDDFCLKDFHHLVLGSGPVPLQMLVSTVNAALEPTTNVEPTLEVLVDAPVHVIVQEKVDVEREELLRRQKEEAQALHDKYPGLHLALRDNGLLGQKNDGMQYMDYIVAFVERGVTQPEQLYGIEPHVLVEIGLTPMEQRLFKKIFKK